MSRASRLAGQAHAISPQGGRLYADGARASATPRQTDEGASPSPSMQGARAAVATPSSFAPTAIARRPRAHLRNRRDGPAGSAL